MSNNMNTIIEENKQEWQQEPISESQEDVIVRAFKVRAKLKDYIPYQKQVDQFDPQIVWLMREVKKLNIDYFYSL